MMVNGDEFHSCPNCGAPMRPNSKFCSKCGADINAMGLQHSPMLAPPAAPTPQSASQPERKGVFDTLEMMWDSLREALGLDKGKEAKRPSPPPASSPSQVTQRLPAAGQPQPPPPAPPASPAVTQPTYRRALRQSAGTATHNGRLRDHNEDFVAKLDFSLDQSGTAEPLGLYIVADGMGGQAAGELASEGSVKRTFLRFIERRILPGLREQQTRRLDTGEQALGPADILGELVQEANHLVHQASRASRANRGTTITAALIIGRHATIANVGDSRTYLFRANELHQVTTDHSLVYSLYKSGQIPKDQIYMHPQKNEIYRSLGDKAEVQVDTFPVTLRAGDRLLLCSDGLWEMVRDPQIIQILQQAASPQAACDALIQAANHNGGEDNISAIVINLE